MSVLRTTWDRLGSGAPGAGANLGLSGGRTSGCGCGLGTQGGQVFCQGSCGRGRAGQERAFVRAPVSDWKLKTDL